MMTLIGLIVTIVSAGLLVGIVLALERAATILMTQLRARTEED